MPTTLTCTECNARLTLCNTVLPGAKVKCPKCAAIIRYQDPDEDRPAVRKKTTAVPAPRTKVKPIKDDDRPVRKKSSAVTTSTNPRRPSKDAVQDSENTRRRGKTAVRRNDDDDDDEDDAPRSRKRKQEPSKKGLIIGLAAGGGALVLGAVILIVCLMGGKKDTSNQQAAVNPPPANPPANAPVNPQNPLNAVNPPANPPANAPVNPPADPPANPPANPPVSPVVTRPVNPVIPSANPPASGSIAKEVMEQVKLATVFVKVTEGDGTRATGSGFVDAASGLVLTNAHVVGMKDKKVLPKSVQVVLSSGQGRAKERTFPASVVTVDQGSDLAVLQLKMAPGDPPLPAGLSVQTSKDLFETQKLWIFGFPQGQQLSLTAGNPEITITDTTVSSLRKNIHGELNQVQVNGGMHPGNSGGPVVDVQGRLVGVAVAGIVGTSINFAIPSDHVLGVLNGRIHTIATEDAVQRDGRLVVKVSLGTIDPMQRLQKLSVDYWVGDASMTVPSSSTQPAGQRQTVTLSYDAANQKAQGEVVLSAVPPKGQVLWLQPSAVSSNGQARWLSGLSRVIEAPPEPKPIEVAVQQIPGKYPVALKTKGTFNLKMPSGEALTVVVDIKSNMQESIHGIPAPAHNVFLGVDRFTLAMTINGQPAKNEETKDDLQRIVNDTRLLGIHMTVDGRGASRTARMT